jgi:peroxiredoxin
MVAALDVTIRLVLAIVFAVASISKATSFALTRESVADFGVPRSLAAAFSVVLIAAEFAVAVLMVPATTAFLGGVGAVCLFALFSGAIAVNLTRGRRPKCNCFGQLHPTEIGWRTLVRNLIFGTFAVWLVANPEATRPISLVAWAGALDAAQLAVMGVAAFFAAVLALIAALLVQVLRQQGRMLLRFDAIEHHLGLAGEQHEPLPSGLAPGEQAPTFELPDLDGDAISLERLLRPQKPALLVFTHPGCGPCLALLPSIARWQQELDGALTVAVVSESTVDENRAKFNGSNVRPVLLQREREIADLYQAYATPSALVVAPDGRIASFVAQGPAAIEKLVLAFRVGELQMPPPPPVSIGEPAPPFALKTAAGADVSLASLEGKRALLVFWSQGCGFCQQMVPQLQAWEAQPHADAPRLVLVSSSGAEEHRGLGLSSPLVLDEGSALARAFGAHGTPMAVMIGPDGRVASNMLAGAHEILATLGSHEGKVNGSLV